MDCIDILFTELLHHTCLMYGLKQTFEAMPQLNKRVVEVGDRSIIIDNAIAPPPTLCNPKYRRPNKTTRSLVRVSYWGDRLSIEYNDSICTPCDIEDFAKTLVQNYLRFRHGYLKIRVEGDKVINILDNQVIAQIG